MRESVCKYMCPYARFQSVMVDDDTFVVTYDPVRGEPRGGRSRRIDHKEAGMGDCVDCTLCVQVCPTGIDIRDGLQYMCIGCGACVDVCEQVMDKMDYDRGLIRYTSGRAIKQRLTQSQVRRRALRPRILIYAALLAVIAAALVTAVVTRSTLRVDVMRDRGVLGREVAGGFIENVYRLQVINTGEEPLYIRIGAEGLPGMRVAVVDHGDDEAVHIDALSNLLVPIVIRTPVAGLTPGMYEMNLTLHAESGTGRHMAATEHSSFYVPR
jgi:cytochrome c oxidase accessory protein FixG